MRMLLLGGTGQVGREFRALPLPSDVSMLAPTRAELDMSDSTALERFIAAARCDVVVNAAAYTDVDRAETDQAKALEVNAAAPSRLALETARLGVPLIHISTDYVFDGRKGVPYVEEDEPAPLNVYGASKLAGERAISAANPRHVILRTSWVYSPYGKNFIRTILRLSESRERLSVVADQRGCPTAAKDIAASCLAIAIRCAESPGHTVYGTYHYTGTTDATWFEFANAIVEKAPVRRSKNTEVVPICTADYPTSARRPADTRLNCAAIRQNFAVSSRSWQDGLAETLSQLIGDRVTL